MDSEAITTFKMSKYGCQKSKSLSSFLRMHFVPPALQIIIALGLLNVWLLRAKSPTPYRGKNAGNLKSEFEAYGLPAWMFYLVGVLKIASAFALILGFAYPALILPAAALVATLMLGALAMHIKVKDAWIKSLPALTMLILSLILSIQSTQGPL